MTEGSTEASEQLLEPLRAVPPARRAVMREAILDLLPTLVYARDATLGDAVDHGLRGLRASRPEAFL